MDPISNADRLVLILRQKLQERAKGARAGQTKKRDGAATTKTSGLRELAAIEGIDERPLRRAFIQNLLADQLGPELINDAQFQQVVSRVTDAIEDDPASSKLLSRLIGELRVPP
jgi:hypothetical protein